LQASSRAVVQFRGSGTARVSSGRLDILESAGLESWAGWAGARRMPGAGVAFREFEVTMHAPRSLAR
ncbi:MAG: hypothetical protein M3680_22010, partial [Myxococcota bacterium]|nr:hypothetical protein [Myxococcota bacterium]